MKYKPNQRVAYYEVTGISDPSPAPSVKVGSVLVDRPQGKHAEWSFFNFETCEHSGWIVGKNVGFARIDPETMKPVPEPGLQAYLDRRKAEQEAAK